MVSAGEVSWTESCGKCNFQPVRYSVLAAKRVGTDRLEMRARRVNPDGTGWRSVYDLVMLKTGIRLRTMHYQAVGGAFITRDGRILGTREIWTLAPHCRINTQVHDWIWANVGISGAASARLDCPTTTFALGSMTWSKPAFNDV